MDTAAFIKALDLEKSDHIDNLGDTFDKLDGLRSSFVALNWHSSHEYLYISPKVADISGYPYKNFHKHGIMFLFSVTPPDLIGNISDCLVEQIAVLEDDPVLLTDAVRLDVSAAIIHSNGDYIPMRCVSTVLDFIPGQRKTYLVLSTYISVKEAGSSLQELIDQAYEIQGEIHRLYIQMNPNRFRAFRSYHLLTPRELEIAQLIRDGFNSKRIAEELSIALHTVTSHRKSIMKKLEASNTAEMVHMLNQVH